ncbi:uncharacterized protein IWZ02DRAFT_225382 [Phyllosticta citriasiana]|uniref:Uncharacterized protein n=1 Tax=Phyllosticta citriasiana TaxID=595635 RepID=A0ABR1KP11_9PEZI
MAYVPPALRKKQEAAQAALQDTSATNPPPDTHRTPPKDLPSLHDIYDHFHPVDLAVQSATGTDVVNSTLHSCSAEPGKLKYVVLFVDANPRWASDKIIFAKSNLHLLPGAPKQDSSAAVVDGEAKAESGNEEQLVAGQEEVKEQQTRDQQQSSAHQDATLPQTELLPNAPHESTTIEPNLGAIAVFEQVGSRAGGLRFAGYHRLTRVQYLEPRSADLVRMLEQKWSIPDKYGRVRQIRRDSDKWMQSLGYRWAVLKFEQDGEADATLDPPDVKVGGEREREMRPQRSVNEMLRELRLGKEVEGEAEKAAEEKPS